jgi:hypothetical protein
LVLPGTGFTVDADGLAQTTGNVKSLNLIILGFALAVAQKTKKDSGRLFCTLADIENVVESNFGKKGKQAAAFVQAIKAGYEALT